MKRSGDWLRDYIEYCSGQESPEMFHQWCGISLIASVMERNVWIDRGYYKLYPNLYIIIVADSALQRKSTAICEMALGLLRSSKYLNEDMNFASQKTTGQAFISDLNKQFKKKGISASFIVADELSSFLGNTREDMTLVVNLTKIYTCPDIFDYHTIARGKELCNLPCVNLLGGTTAEWIKESFPPHAIAGGFAGRIIFVHFPLGDGIRQAWPNLSDEKKLLKVELVKDLEKIRKLEGEFIVTPTAKEWFTSWYEEVFPKQVDAGEVLVKGYYGRKHDTLLKLGMTLACSEGSYLQLEVEHLTRALGLLNKVERYLPAVMRKLETNESGGQQIRVLGIIQRMSNKTSTGWVDHSDLLRNVSYFLKAKELSEIVEGMIESNMVECEVKGAKRFYKIKTIE